LAHANLRLVVEVLVVTIFHSSAGARVICALTSKHALVCVVDGVLACQLVKFALLQNRKLVNELNEKLTIKKSKKKQEAA